MKGHNPSKDGNFKDTDIVQSDDWSLLCISHQKNEFIFELVNLKTERAHKLIFTGAGTNELSRASNWTNGIYPLTFKTNFPANFENFDDTLAMLTPDGETGRKVHLLRIGWLASVRVNQPPGEGFGTWCLYGNCRIEYGSGERTRSSKPATKPTGNHAVTVLAWARVN